MLAERTNQAIKLLAKTRQRWQRLLDNLDLPLVQALPQLMDLGLDYLSQTLARRAQEQTDARVFDVVQDRTVRLSWKVELLTDLQALFSGDAGKRTL